MLVSSSDLFPCSVTVSGRYFQLQQKEGSCKGYKEPRERKQGQVTRQGEGEPDSYSEPSQQHTEQGAAFGRGAQVSHC